LKKPVSKLYLALTLGVSVWYLVGCQTVNTKGDPTKAVQVRTQLAAEYIKSNDYDTAKRTLDQALDIDSRDASANMMMGVLLQREGSPQNVEPKNAQARNNYGTYLYQIGRYNDAIDQLQVAASTLGYDQRYRAFENLGRAYIQVGRVAEAEAAFKQALQVSSNAYLAMIEMAEILYLRQQYAEATQYYEQFVRAVGEKNLDARALWIGIRIARANHDTLGSQVLVNCNYSTLLRPYGSKS